MNKKKNKLDNLSDSTKNIITSFVVTVIFGFILVDLITNKDIMYPTMIILYLGFIILRSITDVYNEVIKK